MATTNSVGNGLSGSTGTGSFVGATSPTLTTPVIGEGTVTFSGAHSFTATLTGDTAITFPTSGTLATTADVARSTTTVDSTPYNVLITDDIILVDTDTIAGASSIVLLASPANDGQVWTVKDWSGMAGTHNITVSVAGAANTIDGAATFVISSDYESVGFAFSTSESTYSVIYEAKVDSGGSVTLTGDSGTASGSAINVLADVATLGCGSSVKFTGNNSDTLTLTVSDTDDNTLVGDGTGKAGLTGTNNTALGVECFTALTTAHDNTALGYHALNLGAVVSYSTAIGSEALLVATSTTCTYNTAVGYQTLKSLNSSGGGNGTSNTAVGTNALGNITNDSYNVAIGTSCLETFTSGSHNVAVGVVCGQGTTSGDYNLFLGHGAGSNISTACDSNIYINALGVDNDNNTLRIGTATGTGDQELAAAYIYGIAGVNVGSVATVVTESGDKLGTAVITAGSGISVTPSANAITISAPGALTIATISGTSQSAAVNTKYFALNSAQTTVTLPSTYAVGDVVALIGATANTGGWIVTASSGDTIRVNNATTSAGGSVTSAAVAGQTIILECDVANTSWVMTSTVSTTLTTS